MKDVFRNKLLLKLPSDVFDTLRGSFERVDLPLRERVVQANKTVDYVYFPESGQVSVVARCAPSEAIEVGMIGFEGMTDFAPDYRSPLDAVVQVPGIAHRISMRVLSAARDHHSILSELIFRYQRSFLTQVSFTALSHGSYSVGERLARWLLMAHDRVGKAEIPLVHEFFSWMLAVRRAGVSEALAILQNEGSISMRRGVITILDRHKLVEAAAGSYGAPEAEYTRLIDEWDPRDKAERAPSE